MISFTGGVRHVVKNQNRDSNVHYVTFVLAVGFDLGTKLSLYRVP